MVATISLFNSSVVKQLVQIGLSRRATHSQVLQYLVIPPAFYFTELQGTHLS